VYHEIFDDPEWGEEFHNTIVKWLLEHVGPKREPCPKARKIEKMI